MTDHTMTALDAALQMTDAALAKPQPRQEELCPGDDEMTTCLYCRRRGWNNQGKFYAELYLCRECKLDGDALGKVADMLGKWRQSEARILPRD